MQKSLFIEAVRSHRLFETLRSLMSFAVARMREAHLQEVASSMTLTTLLSLVPLLAVSLAVFAAFPSFADTRKALEDAVFNSFLPIQYSEVIMKYLKLFSDHASGLGAFGLAGLSLTALLTLGPVGIALSITLTTQAIRIAAGSTEVSLPGWVFVFFQIFLQTFAYAVLFKLVPNCKVPFAHALIGGLFVAITGQIVKEGFEIYITAGTLSSIYGAFVAFPVFLLWLYIAWILVFAGAAVTAAIPQLTSGRFADTYMLGNDFLTGVALLKELTLAREAGRPIVAEEDLARAVDSYPQAIERILIRLSEYDYCAPILENERRHLTAWALLCDPKEKTLRDAVFALLVDPRNGLLQSARADGKKPAGPLAEWFSTFEDDSFIEETLSELARSGRVKELPKA